MRKDRLLKLADFLETVPSETFDIGGWQTKSQTKPEGEKQGECGFAGCAIGWAAHAELFEGFRFSSNFIVPTPVYESSISWRAVDKLFEFDEGWFRGSREASYLFEDASYEVPPTPHDVAERIRKFVAEKSPSGG